MCSPDKLPCKHNPGPQPYRSRSLWLNPLVALLTFFHLPYWVYGNILRNMNGPNFDLKPVFKRFYPTPRVDGKPEYLQWLFYAARQPVYLACVIYYSITFWLQVLLKPRSVSENKFLSDEDFCKTIESSMFVTLMKKQGYDANGDLIYHLGGEPEIVELVKSGFNLPGLYTADYYLQFRIPANATGQFKLKLDWIRLNNVTFTPQDNAMAWKWAKVFAMNGMKTYVVYFGHPKIHFPQEVLNAFARSVLPENHILRQLLTPHMDNQLEITECVLDGSMSLLETHKWYIPYNVTPVSHEDLGKIWDSTTLPRREFFVQKYQFDDNFMYERWLKAYQAVIHAYAAKVMTQVDPRDPYVQLLVQRIATIIPDFPSKLENDDITPLLDYVSNYIFGCSVWHSGDHYSMQDLTSNTAWPQRLRVPPPTNPRQAPAYDGVRSACTLADWYKGYMADAVIYRYTPSPMRDTSILASKYHFAKENKLLHKYVKEFKDDLMLTEEKLSLDGDNIVPLQEILRCIEF